MSVYPGDTASRPVVYELCHGSCDSTMHLRLRCIMCPGEGSAGIMPEEWVCENCKIVIHWQPTIVDGKAYCCLGCAEGGPCSCDYDNLPLPDRVHAMQLSSAHSQPEQHSVER